jgi:hypothetical protein
MQSVETRNLRTVKGCNKLDHTKTEDSKTNENINSTQNWVSRLHRIVNEIMPKNEGYNTKKSIHVNR